MQRYGVYPTGAKNRERKIYSRPYLRISLANLENYKPLTLNAYISGFYARQSTVKIGMQHLHDSRLASRGNGVWLTFKEN